MSNAFAPIVRARPCPIFGRPVHPGFPQSITARYFSSNPSDSGSLRTPCPPASKLAGRRGITPAFGYSAPHPSAEGTLTLLIHALPSAHYGPIRHLPSPTLALTGSSLDRALRPSTAADFPCCAPSISRACCHHYPGGTARCVSRSLPPRHRPSPLLGRVGSHIGAFEACLVFTHVRPARSADPLKGPFLGVLQVIRRLLTRPECFRLEREFAGPDFHRGGWCTLARRTQQRLRACVASLHCVPENHQRLSHRMGSQALCQHPLRHRTRPPPRHRSANRMLQPGA